MMAHEPHLLDFSLPSNPGAMAVEPPPPFAHGHAGLLALQEGGVDMRALARQDLTNAMPWSRPLSSLYNTATGSLAAPPVLPSPASNMYALQLRSSRYLAPVKELLSEFCSLGGDLNATKRAPRTGKWEDMEASSTSTAAWANPSLLTAMDVLELERRKARLISMVEEVDRRYQRYREQMRSIEMSFEAVAGPGSAQVYMELAMRAMSRHFRCLRDGIVSQIRVTRKVMGEKDSGRVTPGATKGETPRLRAIDQCLRQQRAFQQSSALESYSWRPQRGLPERAVSVLRAWLFEHFLHPYPNDVDKHILARQTGLTRSQVSNWFINARVRLWKPMIEDMYMEETKQQEAAGQAGQPSHANQNSMINSSNLVNKKPVMTSTTVDGENLLPANSSSLVSSMLVDGPQFYGYSGLHSGGGGPVSLTLGLQQHPFAPSTMQQPSLMLDVGEEETVLPFRDLMGSQFLHD